MPGPITTHVLDTSNGLPATGLHTKLDLNQGGATWEHLSTGVTDADGRIGDLLPENSTPVPGIYRLTYDTRSYFSGKSVETFYPSVIVIFEIKDTTTRYHIPLLLSPYGYSTYRGS